MAETFNLGTIFADLKLNAAPFVRGLRSIVGPLRTFARSARSAFSAPTRAIANLSRAVARLGRSFAGLLRRLLSVRGVLGGLAAGFGAIKLATLAGDVDKAETSFGALIRTTGTSAVKALDRFREASRGTISDLSILQNVNQAFVLGVGDSVETLEQLFEVAFRLSQASTRTAQEAFGDLALGIGRRSRQLLDNLGIIVRVEQANKDLADSLGKTIDALTDEEKILAFNTAALKGAREAIALMGPETLTFANRLEQLNATVQNFFATLARNLLPALSELVDALLSLNASGLTARLGAALSGPIETLANFIRDNGQAIISFLEKAIRLFTQLTAVVSDLSVGFIEKFNEFLQADAGQRGNIAGEFIEARIFPILEVFAGIGAIVVGGIIQALSTQSANLEKFFQGLGVSVLKGASEGLASLLGGLETIARRLVGQDAQAELDALVTRIEELNEEIDEAGGVRLSFGKDVEFLEEELEKATARAQELRKELGIGEFSAETQFRRRVASTGDAIVQEGKKLLDRAATTLLDALFNRTKEQLTKVFVDAGDAVDNAINRAPAFVQDQESAFVDIGEALKVIKENADVSVEALENNVEKFVELRAAVNTLQVASDSGILTEFLKQAATVNREVGSAIERLGVLINNPALQFVGGLGQDPNAAREEEASILTTIKTLLDAISQVEAKRKKDLQDQRNETQRLADVDKIREKVQDDLAKAIERQKAQQAGLTLEVFDTVAAFEEVLKAAKATPDEAAELTKVLLRVLGIQRDVNDAIKQEADARQQAIAAAEKLRREEEARVRTFQQRTGAFLEDLTFSLIEALENGEDAIKALAEVFRREMENQLSDLLKKIGDQLGEQLATSLGSSAVGTAIGAAVFAAAAFALAELDRQRNRGAEVTEIPVEEIATSQSAVRGVVAGPSNIAIAEVGGAIREANRGVESLLADILETLREISGNSLAAGGFGAVGTG